MVVEENRANDEESPMMRLFNSFLTSIGALSDAISTTLENKFGSVSIDNLRMMLPRVPWHVSAVKLTGVAARDVSAHFAQRWNFSRMMRDELEKSVLVEVTEDVYFSTCSRCGLAAIHESEVTCPQCEKQLGLAPYFLLPILTKLPPPPASYSYVVFECHFPGRLGVNLFGDGPVVIENISEFVEEVAEGALLHAQGPHQEVLLTRGLFPGIGDVLLSVDGVGVSHLNAEQVILIYFDSFFYMFSVQTIHSSTKSYTPS